MAYGDRIVSEKILEPQDYIRMAIVQLGGSAFADRLILKDFSGMPLFLTERRSDLPWILGPRKRGPYMLYFIMDHSPPSTRREYDHQIQHVPDEEADKRSLIETFNHLEDPEFPNQGPAPMSHPVKESTISQDVEPNAEDDELPHEANAKDSELVDEASAETARLLTTPRDRLLRNRERICFPY
ncbi:hypothetical protein QBC47DRAFT_401214 [Echria macrotheca]|uniref:Uncharacterized protein n=1 Tax=Echria macrotheca TaxID=438768 RepID=A0AAJ0FCN3_9PEZI|nr:hypothetical protein QBC47DRAFT_401214 [Echria macrotheca]